MAVQTDRALIMKNMTHSNYVRGDSSQKLSLCKSHDSLEALGRVCEILPALLHPAALNKSCYSQQHALFFLALNPPPPHHHHHALSKHFTGLHCCPLRHQNLWVRALGMTSVTQSHFMSNIFLPVSSDSPQAALRHCHGSVIFTFHPLISSKPPVLPGFILRGSKPAALHRCPLFYWSAGINDSCVSVLAPDCIFLFCRELKNSGAMELRVGNKYRLGRKIGSGSFGDIYLGEDFSILLKKSG